MEDPVTVINLLTNSGLKVFGMDNTFLYFQDPTCVLPAFDTLLRYAWIIVCGFTAILLLGWGVLYIKNGVKINTFFGNAKSLILIFVVLGVIKPAVDFVHCGTKMFDNQCALLARQCDVKQVEISSVQNLLDMRKKTFGQSDQEMLYEVFNVIDTGVPDGENSIEIYEDGDFSFGYDMDSDQEEDGITISSNPSNTISDVAHIESGKGFVIYVKKDGTKIKRSGGSVAWRNNNPGNIIKSRFANSHGGVGYAGRFAVFPDEETGLRATMSLLRSKNYKNLQLRQVYNKWAPSSDGNNPNSYAQNVSRQSGVPLDKRINELSDTELRKVARAMQKFESWKVGKEQIM